MDKTFDFAAVERRTAEMWERTGAFRAGRPERAGAEPFCIVIPPPNVTGNLHMGHALNNTLQDVLCRYWRMKGRDVLWQPGTDHAGIATQMVVERQLQANGEDRRALGRQAFLERVWAWKAESGGAIVGQLKRLGASCDWSRERFTLDEGLSKAVAKVFVQLHREGLIYRDKRLVNWDPKFQTAISDLEVQQIECKGSFKWSRESGEAFDEGALAKALAKNPNGHLYHFEYPFEDETQIVTVATTRPETMLGDTAVAVHPDDERYSGWVGSKLRLPLVGRLIPLVADEYSDPEKGTGAVKITPAHDFNDFEVGRRHEAKGVRPINILDAEGRVALSGNIAFFEGVEAGDHELTQLVATLDRLDRFAARAKIVGMMAREGRVARIEPHAHMVPHGDRSGVAIEPWLTDQWYVDAKTLAQPALAAVRDGKTVFTPKNWEKTYFDWLENIQPWCVSRQLWWGHQIPAWSSPWGGTYVEEDEETAFAVALADGVERGALTAAEAEALADQPEKLAEMFPRDEDVLDTWFSSALWPFSTLGWPEETAELERFYPTSVLVTGFDIIFFWVARMMMMGLHFQKEIPFRDVYIHALVRDERGAKMSKSKGNVIDPLTLIEQCGADALRFTLAAMAAQGRDIKLSIPRVEGYRNFATKLWNASRFAEMNGCARLAGFEPATVTDPLNRWILAEAAAALAEVATGIEEYRFNDAANAAYRFVWSVLCDWCLELAKPVLQGEASEAAKAETRATIAHVLDLSYAMLHPFMPFLTEELWAIKGAEGPTRTGPLALAAWPEATAPAGTQAAEAEIGWVIELIEAIRSVRSEMAIAPGASLRLALVAPSAEVEGYLQRWRPTLERLARIEGVDVVAEPPRGAVALLVRDAQAALPLEGLVDFGAERARLEREIAREQGEIAKVDAKLGNPDFLARAPEEIVEENRERREAAVARIERLKSARARLENL
jgi:valyl-tRNA synthetase